MLDAHGRKHFDLLFDRTASCFLVWGLNPNQVTAAALAVGLCSGLTLYLGFPLPAVALLWLSGFLDAVDGSMARQSETSSLTGALFDIVSDRIVELSIFWALALLYPGCLYAMLGLLTAVLLSMTVFLTTGMLVDKTSGKSFYYQAGLMERTEGFIASSLMMLLPQWLTPLAWLYTALIGVTVVQRLAEAVRLLNQQKHEV